MIASEQQGTMAYYAQVIERLNLWATSVFVISAAEVKELDTPRREKGWEAYFEGWQGNAYVLDRESLCTEDREYIEARYIAQSGFVALLHTEEQQDLAKRFLTNSDYHSNIVRDGIDRPMLVCVPTGETLRQLLMERLSESAFTLVVHPTTIEE